MPVNEKTGLVAGGSNGAGAGSKVDFDEVKAAAEKYGKVGLKYGREGYTAGMKSLHAEEDYLEKSNHTVIKGLFTTMDFVYGAALIACAAVAMGEDKKVSFANYAMYITLIFWGVIMVFVSLLNSTHEAFLRESAGFLFTQYGKPAFLFYLAAESLGLMEDSKENLIHWWLMMCTIGFGLVNGIMQLFTGIHNKDYREYLLNVDPVERNADASTEGQPLLAMESGTANVVRSSLQLLAGDISAKTVQQLWRRFSMVKISFERGANGTAILTKSVKLYQGADGRISNTSGDEPMWDSTQTFTYKP